VRWGDKAGASFGDAARTLKSCPRDNGVTRTLVPGSLEAYPMKDCGAVQIGRHVFKRAGEPGAEKRSSCTGGSATARDGG
jgi:hypothetical protein